MYIMRSRKRFLLGLLCLSVFFGSANKSQAKSVYAITDHHSSTLKAYDIQGDKLEYQADVEVADYANGAVGIAICSRLERIFVTYEDEGKIVWADSKTLKQKGFMDLCDVYSSAGNLAGIVADEEKELDLRISSCYNKIILLPEKMSGIIGTFERERSES